MTNDSTFQDLASAVQEIERLKSENDQLKDELNGWKNAALRVGEDFTTVGPPNYYGMTPTQWVQWAITVIRPFQAMKCDLDEAKAENARLAAALDRAYWLASKETEFTRDDFYKRIGYTLPNAQFCKQSALCDLLAPFLDSVEKLHSYDGKDGRREWVSRGDWLHPGECLAIVSERELARLQAVMERKAGHPDKMPGPTQP